MNTHFTPGKLMIAMLAFSLGGAVLYAANGESEHPAAAIGATASGNIPSMGDNGGLPAPTASHDALANKTSVASTLSLIRQLRASGDKDGVFRMTSLLADPASQEGLLIARSLLKDKDASLRHTGVDILTGHSMTNPEVHALALETLRSEKDTQILVHLLSRLDAPIDLYGKDGEMLSTLHGLLSHSSADVRTQTLLQLLQWEDFTSLEGYVYQALNDSSPAVRLSAATVISLIDSRSETLKSALVTLRDNPEETADIHQTAAAAINRIELMQQDSRNDARTARL